MPLTRSLLRVCLLGVIAILCADWVQGVKGAGPTSESDSQPSTETTLNASNILLEAPAYSSGAWQPTSIVVADVNGDGKPDLLIAHDCQSSNTCPNGVVSVLLGNGDGTFQTAVNYSSGGSFATSIAVGDMNGDGKPDIVVTNFCPISCPTGADGLASVLLGNGDGTFQSAVTYDSGSISTGSVAIGDVNGDGKQDIVLGGKCNTSNCTTGLVGVLLGNGDGTFKTAVSYNSGQSSSAVKVALADVNADKKLDVVVANPCSNATGTCHAGSVGVLLGKGDGTFKGVVTYASGGSGAGSVALADVNGDGRPDIVVANSCPVGCSVGSDGVVGVLLGNGDGTFQAAVGHDSGGVQAGSVAVADVNGDGRADIVVTNRYSNLTGVQSTAAVLLGNGNGTFKAAVAYDSGGNTAQSVAVADVNHDGKADLLVVNVCPARNFCPASGGLTGGSVVGVLLGNGNGTFQAAGVYATGGLYPSALAVGDVNGDHVLDLVVSNVCPISLCTNNMTNGTVAVLRGNGNGTFQKPVLYNSGGVSPVSIAVADLNGDGKPDIVVANLCPNQTNCSDSTSKAHGAIGVLLNNGNGTFKAAVDYDSGGPWASSVAVSDVNGDGKPDIIVTNQCPHCGTVGTVAVLLGNGDGTFQTAVTHSSGGFYPVSVTVADVNGDGKPDIIVGNECLALSCAHGEVGVLLGNGDGTFKNVKVYSSAGSGGGAVAVGDVNGDGKPDIVMANTASVAVLLGNGTGTFQAAILTVTPDSGGGQLALADFNGDGKLDVASGGDEALLLGNGDGTFGELTTSPGGLGAAVGDFNGDGKPDLAVGGVEVLLAK